MDIEGLKERLSAKSFALDDVVPLAEEAAQVIESLQRENEQLRKRVEVDLRHSYDGIACRDTTIKELQRELEEARRDAERIEWLEGHATVVSMIDSIRIGVPYQSGCSKDMKNIRAAIDAARNQKI